MSVIEDALHVYRRVARVLDGEDLPARTIQAAIEELEAIVPLLEQAIYQAPATSEQAKRAKSMTRQVQLELAAVRFDLRANHNGRSSARDDLSRAARHAYEAIRLLQVTPQDVIRRAAQ